MPSTDASQPIVDGNYIFLDYAMALGWGDGREAGTWNVLGGILDQIENVSDDTVTGIVNRIPDDYLVPEQREVVLHGLIGRRALVRGLLAQGVAVIVPDQLDAISKAVLADTHQLIRKYVDEAFQNRDPQAPLGDVLKRVYHALRNTMHVSMIAEPAHVDVASADLLGPTVIHLVQQGLIRSLGSAGFRVEHASATPSSRSQPLPAVRDVDMPSSFLWAPPGPSSALTATA